MKHTLLAAAALAVLCGPASAMNDRDCTVMWTIADANADGKLDGAEAQRYAAWMRVADKTVEFSGTISRTVFNENCKADVFTTATMDEGAPLSGANSFTEGQAKDRTLAAGYASVSAMTKDDNGIWRGTATVDGKTMNIAVDYKGNVVAS